MNPALVETLRSAQRLGFFGRRSVEEAIEHSMDFVGAITDVDAATRLVDLGSGGGLPGLLIADRRPDIEVVLLDRRQKRTDFLERAVTRLGQARTTVLCADVSALIGAVRSGSADSFDIVTARGFGPPEFTLRSAAALLADHGRVVISEPPAGDRWDPDLLAELGFLAARHGAVRVFERHSRRR